MIKLIPNLSIFGCEVNTSFWLINILQMLTELLEVKCNRKCFLFQEKFSGVDIRVTVKGGGHVAQVYAIRQAISKALIAFYQKCKYIISSII